MIRALTLALMIGVAPLAPRPAASSAPVVLTGWISDINCAAPRVARGEFGPNGPECVKRCLLKGVKAVFVSEEAKAMYELTGYESAKDDVGYHLELTGVVDPAGKSIAVVSVKRLEYVGALCALPKKPAPKKG